MSPPYATFPAGVKNKFEVFELAISEQKIDGMRQLLKLSKLPPPTFESLQADRRYGVTSRWLSEAKDAWLSDFDWRKIEQEINESPNYILPVQHSGDTLRIHFIGLFSERKDAVLALVLHGWPSSILEFVPILRLLTSK